MESPIFRAALVLLVIASFCASENQIANTVGVAIGVGAYFCISYVKTPPSLSSSPSPTHIRDIQDLKQVMERHLDSLTILTQQNAAQIQDLKPVIQRNHDILTKQNEDLKPVIQRNHDILTKQNEDLKPVIQRNHDVLTQQNEGLRQLIQRNHDILTKQNAAQIQDLKQQIANSDA
jgi:hypothetical protein